jgi:hypothetical protein
LAETRPRLGVKLPDHDLALEGCDANPLVPCPGEASATKELGVGAVAHPGRRMQRAGPIRTPRVPPLS